MEIDFMNSAIGRASSEPKSLILPWVFFLFLMACLSLTACTSKDPLTPEERAWLEQKDGKLIVNNESGWPPIIDTDKDGNFYGIVMDVQKLLEDRLNFRFKMDRPDSWENFMARFRRGEIDVNNNLQRNSKRAEYALFTKPYIEIPNAIIVRKEVTSPLTLDKMRGMTIAVTNNFAIHEHLKTTHGYLKILPFKSDLQCLLETATRNVDAAVVNLAVASFIIEQKGIANLRVAGYDEYANGLPKGVCTWKDQNPVTGKFYVNHDRPFTG